MIVLMPFLAYRTSVEDRRRITGRLTPLAAHHVHAGVVQYAGIVVITYFVLGDRIREYAGRILHVRG